jgi:hypothetical protein
MKYRPIDESARWKGLTHPLNHCIVMYPEVNRTGVPSKNFKNVRLLDATVEPLNSTYRGSKVTSINAGISQGQKKGKALPEAKTPTVLGATSYFMESCMQRRSRGNAELTETSRRHGAAFFTHINQECVSQAPLHKSTVFSKLCCLS